MNKTDKKSGVLYRFSLINENKIRISYTERSSHESLKSYKYIEVNIDEIEKISTLNNRLMDILSVRFFFETGNFELFIPNNLKDDFVKNLEMIREEHKIQIMSYYI